MPEHDLCFQLFLTFHFWKCGNGPTAIWGGTSFSKLLEGFSRAFSMEIGNLLKKISSVGKARSKHSFGFQFFGMDRLTSLEKFGKAV